ncbi:MAG: hypothetical protein NC926_09410 [Candidatus Omnitrophica bacterium]|nr:hypothetical protein [Candidatus Omnitrophota bacterium]
MDELKRKLIANLEGYLRERQDFIASIPTMDPIWSAPMDIIRDIFEPILGNLNNKCPNLFLLFDNITRSEGIRAGAIKFEIKIITKSGENKYTSKFEVQDNKSITYKFEKQIETGDEDYKAAIYLGTSGCHAFYSIIENILRNTTRHSNKKALSKVVEYSKKIMVKQSPQNNCQPLKITIEFHIDDEQNQYKDDYILVKIYDNMGGWERKNNGIWILEEKENELKQVVLEENVKEEDAKQKLKNYITINEELNKKIFNRRFNPECPEGKIIDETGKVIEGGWGLKEMRICASFLRGFKIENYEQVPENEPPVITPYIQPDNKNTGSLGYKFYLPKVKDLLIISKNIAEDNNIKKKVDTLKSQGIYIENDVNKIIELQNKGKFTHEFVVIDIDKKNNIDFIEKHYLELPYKLFYLTNNPQNFPECIKNIDEKWEKKIIKKDEFKEWFSSQKNFTINKKNFVVNDTDPNSLKSYERVILEIKKRWIEYLNPSKEFKRIGIYYIEAEEKIWNRQLIFKLNKSNIKRNRNIKNNVILDHRYEKFSEIINKNPYCVIPFAHGISNPITVIKRILCPKKEQTQKVKTYDVLTAYFNALEMAETKFWIIDERIYDEAKQEKNIFINVNLGYHWKLQNIIISDLEKKGNNFNLKVLKFTTNTLNQKPQEIEITVNNGKNNEFEEIFQQFKDTLHYIVIHQTIITKIGRKDQFLKFLGLLPQGYKPWHIVVTSGRGHPPTNDMPPYSKFCDFSNLRKYMVENPNKFLISKILSSLKEGKNE